MNLLQNYYKYILLLILAVITIYNLSFQVSLETNKSGQYDEQMWTGASITSYEMFFNDYNREGVVPERWFRTFAQRNNYNLQKMPYDELQWFDDALWTFGWKAPNIAKYLMGFAIVNFGDNVDPDGYFYKFSQNRDENKWPGNFAPEEFVLIARTTNAVLTFITIVVIVITGWLFFNYWVGFIAGFYLALNENFIRVSSAAGVDGASIMFSALVVLFSFFFIKHLYNSDNRKQILIFGSLIGISFPLAVGSKLSAALNGYVFVIFIVIATFYFIKQTNSKDKKRKALTAAIDLRKNYLTNLAISAIVILSLTYIIFVYSNPVLYDSAILKMRMINDSVKEFFDIRANAKGSTELNESWLIGLWYVIKRNLIVLEENYYATFGILLNFKFNLLDGLFFGSGIWALAKRSFTKIKNNLKADFELFLLIWMLVYLWGISDFLWADFRRYYMQLYPGFAIIIGIGIVEIINQIKTKVEKK